MRQAVWLLDVDEVVNVTRPGWGAVPCNGTACIGAVEYRLRWAPAVRRPGGQGRGSVLIALAVVVISRDATARRC
jgi:hypothetical protein